MNQPKLPELIKYRDIGMNTYTYFWTKDKKIISPFFNNEKEAKEWLNKLKTIIMDKKLN